VVEKKGSLAKESASPRGRGAVPAITRGLLILEQPLNKILSGTKTWEIRSRATARRGPIALIQSKSGLVVGTCEVVDVVGPLSLKELQRNERRAGFFADKLNGPTYAWVLRNARRLDEPVPYRHPSGAVIWVVLQPDVVRRLKEQRRLCCLARS
jgi:ASCH domain